MPEPRVDTQDLANLRREVQVLRARVDGLEQRTRGGGADVRPGLGLEQLQRAAVSLHDWETMGDRARVEARLEAQRSSLQWLQSLSPHERPTGGPYVVVCLHSDGPPEVVHVSQHVPSVAELTPLEQRLGAKCWCVATSAYGVAEEPGPPEPDSPPGEAAALPVEWALVPEHWRRHSDLYRRGAAWVLEDDDAPGPLRDSYYPRVWVRVSARTESGGLSESAVVFCADVDTGSPYCVIPFRPLLDSPDLLPLLPQDTAAMGTDQLHGST